MTVTGPVEKLSVWQRYISKIIGIARRRQMNEPP